MFRNIQAMLYRCCDIIYIYYTIIQKYSYIIMLYYVMTSGCRVSSGQRSGETVLFENKHFLIFIFLLLFLYCILYSIAYWFLHVCLILTISTFSIPTIYYMYLFD